MKRKPRGQIQSGSAHARGAEDAAHQVEAQKEIQDYLRALDSYPARAMKHPRLSFRQHLCAIIIARNFQPRERSHAPYRCQ
jgi:hypothetical protein